MSLREKLVILGTLSAVNLLGAGRGGAAPQARIDCAVQENGQTGFGSIRVEGGSGPIAQGSCGRPLDVAPGGYDAVVILDGAADAPESRQRVELKAGQLTLVRASFETGEILIEATRDGRRGVASVKLRKSGQERATLSAGVASRVSTGTYDVDVESRGTHRVISAVTVARGERRTLSVDFSSAATPASP